MQVHDGLGGLVAVMSLGVLDEEMSTGGEETIKNEDGLTTLYDFDTFSWKTVFADSELCSKLKRNNLQFHVDDMYRD